MPLIEWKDEFRTAIASVDHEHEQLIALLNEIAERLGTEPSDADIESFLGEVYAKIAAHFALEEATMRDLNYDQYADHKADHDRLLDDIRDIMERQLAGAYEGYRDKLTEELGRWFVDHFRAKDPRLHQFVERMRRSRPS